MHFAGEVTFLVIPARTPGQVTSDIEIFSLGLTPHVLRTHALFRALVVAATRGMHMVVGAVPAQLGHVNPARELKLDLVDALSVGHADAFRLGEVLRTPGQGDFILPRG